MFLFANVFIFFAIVIWIFSVYDEKKGIEERKMKSVEKFVAEQSDYFIYTPSRQAMEMFLYPLQCGAFTYLPGYSLTRESFDSYLLMYIQKGELTVAFSDRIQNVRAGSFVLLNCYKLHSYCSTSGWECIWCHFDGVTAEAYYNSIVSRLGNVFSLPDEYPAVRKLEAILDVFYKGAPVREPLMSRYLTDILTEFLLYTPSTARDTDYTAMAEEITSYISEHFSENIQVKELAARANMSLYHFIRVFKKETGFTPHEYLVNIRIATARYLLKNSNLTVKDICFSTGFSSESVFCGAFRRHQGMTPMQYRNLHPQDGS